MLEYKKRIEHQRQEKDAFFERGHNSPLSHEDRHNFTGLNYFPVSEELVFDLTIQEYPEKEEFIMQTNTGAQQHYILFGKVKFSVDGKDYELQVYKNPEVGEDYYFIPFWDKTVLTNETYGAGRYLELEPKGNGLFNLDFNIAYNPYCAYNEHYSCPLTPPENRLQVRIEAGEKKFKTDH